MSYSCKTFFCPDSYRDNSDYGFLCACVLAKVSGIFNFSDVPFDVPFLIGRAQCNPGIALRGLTSPLALSKVEGDLLSAGRQLISLHAKTCNVLRRKNIFLWINLIMVFHVRVYWQGFWVYLIFQMSHWMSHLGQSTFFASP